MSSDRLKVTLAGIEFKNPVIPASGCAGFGKELNEFYDISKLGGIAVKTSTKNARMGNKMPRVAETSGGMLNAIGLVNPGVDKVVEEELPWLASKDLVVLGSVGGSNEEEYLYVTEKLSASPEVDLIELNISCPNVKEGGLAFGTDKDVAYDIVKKVKAVSHKKVFVKLTPNVTNIVEIAKAVEAAGADGIVMINTLTGMRLDLRTGKPIIANGTGGMSGPALKPIAIRMIYQVYQAVNIPIIGCGGITKASDVLEFMYAGASAVEVGYANFVSPTASLDIVNDLEKEMDKYGIQDIKDIIGRAHR